ncbi:MULTISPECIES: metal-dependent transcriptional regulator [unclassified Haladaptatus]|uniref:metal-dependent transcriptional regulator n=1 Tax=unclassified Haladaptatus TaxID=2622732 RepID=UPI0023E863DE|nr:MULTISPECIES: metal-dependent transcriptional regulator [unclassified Haladaptatus]
MLSAKMEDYLKVIYQLQRESDGPISTSAIADVLGVKPPTVTSMAKKLEKRELVEREEYKGVRLTPEGETVALEVLRHHRLLETYLTEHLGYDWAAVHDEADRLEHHISEEFERRVAEMLDNPTVDPHGAPIPNANLDPIEDAMGTALSACEAGDEVVIRRVRDGNAAELEYLADAGILPGTPVTIVEVAPIGLVTVRLPDGDEVALSERIADVIRVTEVDSMTENATEMA